VEGDVPPEVMTGAGTDPRGPEQLYARWPTLDVRRCRDEGGLKETGDPLWSAELDTMSFRAASSKRPGASGLFVTLDARVHVASSTDLHQQVVQL
jgi:hypothetical protein